MARKRRRRSIAWEPILGILFAANLLAGLYASRLTSLIKIRVEGSLPEDRARIKEILEKTHSKPALQLDRLATESSILAKSEVLSAEMTRNVFGRARVTVKYREPVAAVSGQVGMAMSADGVIFQTGRPLRGLPSFVLPKVAMVPSAGVIGPWRFQDVALLATLAKGIAGEESVEIEATEEGGLCLNIGSKFAVELGLPEALEHKVAMVSKEIEDNPATLVSGRTFILVSPEYPTYRDGVSRKKQ